nr:hypothetical protein [Acrocarpospora catenulata]
MTDEDDVAQILEEEEIRHLGDVRLQVDIGTHQVGAVTGAGQRRRVDGVAGRLEQASDSLVAPAAVTAAVHQDEACHGGNLEHVSPKFNIRL